MLGELRNLCFGSDLCGFGSLPGTVRAIPVEVHPGEVREIQPLTVTLESHVAVQPTLANGCFFVEFYP
jgi:hypothetical protein